MINVGNKYKALNNSIFLVVFLLCINCKTQLVPIERNCTLSIADKEMVLDGADNETLNNQLREFYNNNNLIDIVFYKSKSGEKDLNFKRIYKDKKNRWLYIEIQNSEIVVRKEMIVNESELDKLFNNFGTLAMYRNCGRCFHCYTYINLIKKGDKTFSYYYDSSSGEITDKNLYKLKPYQRILDFFKQENLSFK